MADLLFKREARLVRSRQQKSKLTVLSSIADSKKKECVGSRLCEARLAAQYPQKLPSIWQADDREADGVGNVSEFKPQVASRKVSEFSTAAEGVQSARARAGERAVAYPLNPGGVPRRDRFLKIRRGFARNAATATAWAPADLEGENILLRDC